MNPKRYILLLAMVLGIVSLPLPYLTALSGLRAQEIGSWQVYPSYWIADKNVAAGKVVYSVANGNLLRYDTEDTSVRTYNSLDDLNDIEIAHIAYSNEAKRLLIVYDNGNIDLLDEDDEVENIVSLKNSTLSDKTVNSVYTDGVLAYLCTGFGFLTVDMAEGIIRDTYRLNVNVQALTIMDGTIYIATDKGIYRSTQQNLHLFANWEMVATSGDNNYRAMVSHGGKIYALRYNTLFRLEGNTLSGVLGGTVLLKSTGGLLIYATAENAYIYNQDWTRTQVTISGAQWQDISYASGTYWVSEGTNGLKGYRIADGQVTETVGTIRPNSPVRDLAYRMQYVGDRLLVAGGINTPYAIFNPATAMYYEDGQWTNFDEEGPAQQYPSLSHWNTTHLVQDPNDPDHHFASPYRTGLYEYRNGKFVGLYNSDNSPLQQIVVGGRALGLNYVGCTGLKYDEDGNLWIMNQQTDTIVRILQPSGKWLALYYEEIDGTPTPDDYLFTTSGVKFLVSRRVDGRGFFGFDTNGTLSTVRDDKHRLRSTIINQDGTTYAPDEFYCMAEDLDGRVWCGTQLGLFVINDPTEFFDNDFTFEQIKISRNDGSNLADYLLSGVPITCIAVDGANRKWIGTSANGIYLVSADGQEMIQHFQANNSPLPSDNVQCIAIHPTTGVVMIGTDVGLCSYVSDATDPEEGLDIDNIVAYPNPVGPDYNGTIAVRGLTRDSEVKICSSTGQLVWSGRSNGGTFTWNGTNKSGRRVSSGVYFVIANTSDGKKAVVCRIIVIH